MANLTSYYFNIGKICLKLDPDPRTEHCQLQVRSWVKVPPPVIDIPDPAPTREELASKPQGEVPGLWVGYTTMDASKYRQKDAHEPNERFAKFEASQVLRKEETAEQGKSAVGVSINKSRDFTVITNQKILRVVVRMDASNPMNYYALINRGEDGLCDTMGIHIEDVFFGREYRDDDAAAHSKRRSSWPLKIKTVLDSLYSSKAAPSQRPMHAPKPMFRLPLHKEAVLEAATQFFIWSQDKSQKQPLTEAMAALKALDADLKHRFATVQIAQLLRPHAVVESIDFAALTLELVRLWPDLSSYATRITEPLLRLLAVAIRDPNAPVVQFQHLRPVMMTFLRGFEANAHGHLPVGPQETKERSEALAEAVAVTIENMGEFAPVPLASTDLEDVTGFLQTEADLCDALAEKHRLRNRALMDGYAAQATSGRVEELWSSMANSPDEDSARLWAGHAIRYAARQLAQLEVSHAYDLEQHASQLRSNIRTLVEAGDAEEATDDDDDDDDDDDGAGEQMDIGNGNDDAMDETSS